MNDGNDAGRGRLEDDDEAGAKARGTYADCFLFLLGLFTILLKLFVLSVGDSRYVSHT
jgi:hypothetical protein